MLLFVVAVVIAFVLGYLVGRERAKAEQIEAAKIIAAACRPRRVPRKKKEEPKP